MLKHEFLISRGSCKCNSGNVEAFGQGRLHDPKRECDLQSDGG